VVTEVWTGIISEEFLSICHGIDLLEAMKRQPSFKHGSPSGELVQFIERIENADPNSEDLSEDDMNASWGHYQLTAGDLKLTTVLTSWESTGGPQTACKLIAVIIQTCKVARHLCYKRGIDASSYLSDIYLENAMDRLWTLWKEAGGVSPIYYE
jgi:hypothetical protein